MTITDIDKQDWKSKLYKFGEDYCWDWGGWSKRNEILVKYVENLLTQAKAEQREEMIKILLDKSSYYKSSMELLEEIKEII